MPRRFRLLVSALALLAPLAAAPAAPAKVYDVPASLAPQLDRVAARTAVAVRVPARLNLDFAGRVFASGTGRRRHWRLSLAGVRDCGGASACVLAEFSGRRGGGTPQFRRTVRLRGGRTGFYKPLRCGASCSPPAIQWRQGRALFSIQAKVGVAGRVRQRRALVAAANSAIARRPL